jgi:alkylhydroperoxidase/carboxymuconolactone decarboxylase family protein YurZ
MAVNASADIDDETRDMFASLAIGQADVLEQAAGLRSQLQVGSGLDPRTFAMVKIAALVAVDAPPASYIWQVRGALEAGVSPRDILGILAAIAPQVGAPRVLAAAPEIMIALDLELPGEMDI